MSPLLRYLDLFLKTVAQVYFDPFGIVMGLDAVKSFSGDFFSVADILRRCPGVGIDMIRRVLKDLQAQGDIECLGRGRNAK